MLLTLVSGRNFLACDRPARGARLPTEMRNTSAPPAVGPPSRCCCKNLAQRLSGQACAQAAALLAQTRFGPRCFIAARFLPAKYDYHRALPKPAPAQGPTLGPGAAAGGAVATASGGDVETGDAGVECVICMNAVDVAGDARARMVTPCHHVFHSSCLTRWMDVKQECPTCRRPLPPP